MKYYRVHFSDEEVELHTIIDYVDDGDYTPDELLAVEGYTPDDDDDDDWERSEAIAVKKLINSLNEDKLVDAVFIFSMGGENCYDKLTYPQLAEKFGFNQKIKTDEEKVAEKILAKFPRLIAKKKLIELLENNLTYHDRWGKVQRGEAWRAILAAAERKDALEVLANLITANERHNSSNYDELLSAGISKQDARLIYKKL